MLTVEALKKWIQGQYWTSAQVAGWVKNNFVPLSSLIRLAGTVVIGAGSISGTAALHLTKVGAALLRINSDTSGNPEIRYMLDGSTIISMGVGRTDSKFRMVYATSISSANGIVMDSGGKIGIRTATPGTELDVAGTVTATGSIVNGKLNLGRTSAVIAAGVITATASYMTVDTQAAAATDDLDTINGGTLGDIIILRTLNEGRDVTIKDGTGNINCEGDRILSSTADTWVGIFAGAAWTEISFANNV
jgi:hypothetical protein